MGVEAGTSGFAPIFVWNGRYRDNERENMIYKLEHPAKAASLFAGWEETIIWSCLQGIMGEIYVDDVDQPTAAKAVLGDFAFFVGQPGVELLLHEVRKGMILVPREEAWAICIEECLRGKVKAALRYAILKEENIFEKEKLQQYAVALPPGYELRMIDEKLYRQCLQEEWSADLVKQFESYELFARYALGVVAIRADEIAAGASSYSAYDKGIEIEVDTKEEHRRKGLATACAAQLILKCLEKGWYPSWDAANLWSVALAEKLGYHRGEEYMIYEIK